MSPVLLHIPHASSIIPEKYLRYFLLEPDALKKEMLLVTDWYTDELYQLSGAERLIFPVNRLLVDPERFENDAEEIMATRGLGAVYTKTQSGDALKVESCRAELMDAFYRPHHSRLDTWALQALSTHGKGLIIDCHSYPSTPLPCDLDQSTPRPDFCLGTSRIHTSRLIVDAAVGVIENHGYSVEIDRPYAGTMVPLSCYDSKPEMQSIMIEINRATYIDETSGEKLAQFEQPVVVLSKVMEAIETTWHSSRIA